MTFHDRYNTGLLQQAYPVLYRVMRNLEKQYPFILEDASCIKLFDLIGQMYGCSFKTREDWTNHPDIDFELKVLKQAESTQPNESEYLSNAIALAARSALERSEEEAVALLRTVAGLLQHVRLSE